MSSVDLSQLPVPQVVEQFDFETIVAQMLADLQARDPDFTALVESDPAYKILEVCAYREVLVRQRANEAAQAVMLAYAEDGDLDNLGALFGVTRLTLNPGDPTQNIAPTMETDTNYRYRITLAPSAYSVAGPVGAYTYYALSADPKVVDCSVTSPTPGQVLISVLSSDGDGTADAALIAAVAATVGADAVRPLTDEVIVQSAGIVPYEVTGTYYTFAGPDSTVVSDASMASLLAYQAAAKKVGRNIPLSALYAAIHTSGIERVDLTSPAADLFVTDTQAAYCSGINLVYGGVSD